MFDGPKAGSVLSVPVPAPDAGTTTQERVVLLMALLVSAAVAGVLHLLAGWPLTLSLPLGLATLGISLLANALAARNAETGRLRLEIARLELELARLKSQSLPNRPAQSELETGVLVSKAALPAEARWDVAAARRSRGATAGAADATPAQAAANAPAPGQQPAADTAQQRQPAEAKPSATAQKMPNQREPARDAHSSAPRQPQSQQSQQQRDDIPAWAAPSADQGDALRADWEKALGEATGSPAQQQARPEAPRMPPVRSVESDLELVQRKIKALADEVNANDASRNAPPQDATQAGAIDDSISALRSTAERMRPRKGFSARPNYAEMTQPAHSSPAQQPSQPQPAQRQQPAAAAGKQEMSAQPAPHAHQPAQSAYTQHGPAAGPSPSRSGELPSLDTLIPATAQPIAVSRPAPEQAGTSGPQTIASMPPQARAPESPRFSEAPPMDYARPEPARAPEPRQSYAPEPQRPAPPQATAREPMQAAPPADRRSTPRRQQDLRVAEIAAAIEQRRMDVYLNPIVGLGDYAVTHFEVDVRLRAEGGGYIDDAEQTLRLQSTDMLALFDIERLERTAQVAEQLDARGKAGSVLSPATGQSMADGDFLEAFARTFEARTAISNQLVLTFTQADVAAFGPSTWQALSDMASFGFRFALQEVTHLSMDFAALAERGFAFVKLPASAFLDGLPAGHGLVPPADICRHLAGSGLTLVVESIDDDQLLGRVFGFGALFGQGSLFGGSRQITLNALGPKRAA